MPLCYAVSPVYSICLLKVAVDGTNQVCKRRNRPRSASLLVGVDVSGPGHGPLRMPLPLKPGKDPRGGDTPGRSHNYKRSVARQPSRLALLRGALQPFPMAVPQRSLHNQRTGATTSAPDSSQPAILFHVKHNGERQAPHNAARSGPLLSWASVLRNDRYGARSRTARGARCARMRTH